MNIYKEQDDEVQAGSTLVRLVIVENCESGLRGLEL